MKILFTITSILLTNSIFGITVEEFGDKFVENFDLQENQSISDFICGIGGCSLNVIENGIKKHNIKFSEEKNQVHNTTKINIEAFDFLDNTFSTAAVVCLSNETCKLFEPENLSQANYAYENDEFINKKSKRCIPCAITMTAIRSSPGVIAAVGNYLNSPTFPVTVSKVMNYFSNKKRRN